MFFGIFLLQNNPLAESGGSNAQNMWANILYVNNFLDISRQFMGWCWSLAIEEQFYSFMKTKGVPDNIDGAFIGFVKKKIIKPPG